MKRSPDGVSAAGPNTARGHLGVLADVRSVREASDPSLVTAMGRHDNEALAELYRRHGGALFALAVRVLQVREMAEEVVQDILVRLWRRPDLFDPNRGSLRSYLLAQTHGRAVDVVRSESSRRVRDERDANAAKATYDLEGEALEVLVGHEVRDAIEALSVGEREAITLAYFGDQTYREVAMLLGEPEGTVKSRIRSGLRRLRTSLVEAGIEIA